MIAFDELVSALDRWRVRNGLPVASSDVPMSAVAIGAVASAPTATALSFARSTASIATPAAAVAAPAPAPARAPAAIVGEASDVLAIGDADVLEDDEMYENEGNDFAMQFGGQGNPVGTASGSIGGSRESTPVAAPVYDDAAPAYDPYAAPPGTGPSAYPLAAQPGSGPLSYAVAAAAASYGSGPYGAVADDPGFDDPAYDPPGGDPHDRAMTDGAYAPPGPDTLDAEADVIDEATVVGSELPKKR